MTNHLKLIKWILRGKTLTRSMLNVKLTELPPLKGKTLDLGGGGHPTYKDILKIQDDFINMDAIAEANPTVVGDLEGVFPFDNEFADTCILFNTLEHVYKHQHVVDEIYRVTKIYVPFIFPFHTHQTKYFLVDDYFRYSESALKRIFNEAGFEDVSIEPHGGLFMVLAEILNIVVKFRVIGVPIILTCILIEPIYQLVRKNIQPRNYPLAYFVKAVK